MDSITQKYVSNVKKYREKVRSVVKVWHTETTRTFDEYEWKVQGTEFMEDGSILIHIIELKQGHPTSGGSSFTFLQTQCSHQGFLSNQRLV